jgi:hypothetical protein
MRNQNIANTQMKEESECVHPARAARARHHRGVDCAVQVRPTENLEEPSEIRGRRDPNGLERRAQTLHSPLVEVE